MVKLKSLKSAQEIHSREQGAMSKSLLVCDFYFGFLTYPVTAIAQTTDILTIDWINVPIASFVPSDGENNPSSLPMLVVLPDYLGRL